MDLARSGNNSFDHYECINAYGAKIEPHIIHEVIRKDPRVIHVEHNHFLDKAAVVEDSGPIIEKPTITSRLSKLFRRGTPTWDRLLLDVSWNIAQLAFWGKRPNDAGHTYETAPLLEGAGVGVHIYIMDTGVRTDHSIFDSSPFKLGKAVDFMNQISTPYCGDGQEDMVSVQTLLILLEMNRCRSLLGNILIFLLYGPA